MKRKLTLLLSAVMIAALGLALAACGGETTVTYSVTFTGTGVTQFVQPVREGGLAVEPREPEREGFTFTGWYAPGEDQPFNFSTPITGDLTLTAGWEEDTPEVPVTEVPEGSGTEADPFVLVHPIQLVYFSEQINAGNSAYLDAWVELGADLDMTGVVYEPAGQTEETAFSGVFDGKGHSISDLSIQTITIEGTSYVGLFGQTSMAVIRNLTLEDIAYTVTSYSSDATVGAEVGGVVGHADLTNFANVAVSGSITAGCPAGNALVLGGLAGSLQTSENYIVYVENCLTDLTLGGGSGAYDEDALGGLFGEVYNLYGTVAVLNSKSAGSILGGRYAGGLIGYANDLISVIDSASTARVEATDGGVSYAGGLVGMSAGDALILNCFTTGRVVAPQATDNLYLSYVGYLVGYGAADDYYLYYTPGTAVVGCYYGGSLSGGDVRNTAGTQQSSFTKDWILENLNWNADCWNFDGDTFDGNSRPSGTRAAETASSFTLTLQNGGQTTSRDMEVTNGAYALLGTIEALPNAEGSVFWAWEHAAGAAQRYYLPVTKDLTLSARFVNVAGIAGTYHGTASIGGSVMDSGIIRLMEDGSMQWITGTTMAGTYRYDGEHIVMYFTDSGRGEVSGTLTAADGLQFEEDAGMTGTVAYQLYPFEMSVVGEYVSEKGWILTVGGESSLSFHDASLNGGLEIDGTFAEEEGLLTLNGGRLTEYFSSLTAAVNDDGTLTVNAQPLSGTGAPALENVTFRRYLTVDYSGAAFLGSYRLAAVTLGYDGDPSMSRYTGEFRADGVFLYSSAYSTTQGRYYYFEQTGQVKIILDGYISTLTFDGERGIFYGHLLRGWSTPYSVVLTPSDRGEITGFIPEDESFMIYTAGDEVYYICDGVYDPDAEISGSFADNGRVTVQGVDYRVVSYTYNDSVSYKLSPIGAEEGTYTYDGDELSFDGLGHISGDRTGSYWVYGDKVFVFFADDEMLRFSLSAAEEADGAITALAGDGWEGIWYAAGRSQNAQGEYYDNPTHFKLVISGMGQATLYYFHEDGTYHFNWNDWGTYSETATGLHLRLNDVQEADVQFYYNKQVVYSKSFGYLEEISFAAAGYTGPTTPPALPASWVGSYTGTTSEGSVILNLRGDLSGSFRGLPFTAVYDGDKTVTFSLDGLLHTLVFDGTVTLSYGEQTLTLTRQGEVTEIIPAALTGTWTGTAYRGSSAVGEVTVVIESDGRVTYNGTVLAHVAFDAEQLIITASDAAGNTYTLTWNAEEETFSSVLRDSENSETTATLTKAA